MQMEDRPSANAIVLEWHRLSMRLGGPDCCAERSARPSLLVQLHEIRDALWQFQSEVCERLRHTWVLRAGWHSSTTPARARSPGPNLPGITNTPTLQLVVGCRRSASETRGRHPAC